MVGCDARAIPSRQLSCNFDLCNILKYVVIYVFPTRGNGIQCFRHLTYLRWRGKRKENMENLVDVDVSKSHFLYMKWELSERRWLDCHSIFLLIAFSIAGKNNISLMFIEFLGIPDLHNSMKISCNTEKNKLETKFKQILWWQKRKLKTKMWK